jgi:hypothetical protein
MHEQVADGPGTPLAGGSKDAPRGALRREARAWLICLALIVPASAPYLANLSVLYLARVSPGLTNLRPTGFIAYDMPYYMANAREHFDGGRFQLSYGNPYSPYDDTRAIYFQPMTLLLGVAWWLTNLDPGVIWVAFGVVAALGCARVALALYRTVVGELDDWPRRLGLVVFFWGGGVLALAGIGHCLATGAEFGRLEVFRFDPGFGWWCLNFGRNLIYPNEALYHAIFFGSILCVCTRRPASAAALALLMSISHPFTGIELLAILAAWAFLEVYFLRSGYVTWRFLAAIVAGLAFHVGYYLVFLPRHLEHRQLVEAWTVPWTVEATGFIPAYLLVGGLAVWSFRRLPLACRFFSEPRNRLFLVWFLVAFALSNHEFAVSKPVQPLHFTRGYEWVALFLMGAEALAALFAWLPSRLGAKAGAAAAAGLLAVLLSDNAVWLGFFPLETYRGHVNGITVDRDRLDLYQWMNRAENRGSLILAPDNGLGYMASVYTPLRAWTGHENNTPRLAAREAELAGLFQQGRMLDDWAARTVLVLFYRKPEESAWLKQRNAKLAFENRTYRVYRITPPAQLARKPGTRIGG